MTKVLFISMHRQMRSPSQRFRFEQYFDFLEENGVKCELSYLISAKDDETLYQPGHFLGKTLILIKSIFKRLEDARRAKAYDYVFIQREAFMTGTTFFERKLSKTKAKIIYDFDDSIWLSDNNEANKKLSFLKKPAKTVKIIKICDLIVAGNQYLADYALQFNPNVKIIPTTIDTGWYKPILKANDETSVCIGWSGSFSTVKHFELAIPALSRIKQKYGDRVRFKLIGDANYQNKELGVQGLAWSSNSELEDLSDIDIGIMPLPDDEWSKGKCGLKGLQYMGLAIPTVMSPVGVNTTIITDGENGFLADSDEEWVEKLSLLIENKELRTEIGLKGRETVVNQYSVEANKKKYLALFTLDKNIKA